MGDPISITLSVVQGIESKSIFGDNQDWKHGISLAEILRRVALVHPPIGKTVQKMEGKV